MIVLDTNVVSEAFRLKPDANVIAWLNRQQKEDVFLTTISLAELLTGVRVLPDGNRKTKLQEEMTAFLTDVFGERLLPFDVPAAISYAEIASDARARGRSLATFDCQIAAIAKVRNVAIATRDIRPFQDAGLRVVNPWIENPTLRI